MNVIRKESWLRSVYNSYVIHYNTLRFLHLAYYLSGWLSPGIVTSPEISVDEKNEYHTNTTQVGYNVHCSNDGRV